MGKDDISVNKQTHVRVKFITYLCRTLHSSIPRDLSPIKVSLGQAESSRVYNACRHVKTLSTGSEDLGLHSASIHIPVQTENRSNDMYYRWRWFHNQYWKICKHHITLRQCRATFQCTRITLKSSHSVGATN